jgi:outer membrane protein assembly factor BamB
VHLLSLRRLIHAQRPSGRANEWQFSDPSPRVQIFTSTYDHADPHTTIRIANRLDLVPNLALPPLNNYVLGRFELNPAQLVPLFLALFVAFVSLAPALAQSDWPVSGHDPGAQRFSQLTQIKAKNVVRLQRAWTFHAGDARDDQGSEGAPLVINGVLYFDAGKYVYALDPVTGQQIWKFEIKGTRRGVSYWPGDAKIPPRLILGVAGGQMLALDAKSGKPVDGFGNAGFVDGVSPAGPSGNYFRESWH